MDTTKTHRCFASIWQRDSGTQLHTGCSAGKDLAERKALALQEQSKTCVSWAKISEVVRSSAEIGKKEAEESLKELLASAKAIGRSEFGCLTPSLPCILK